jgi:hypothetical protein
MQACHGGYDCPFGPLDHREHEPARRRLAEVAPEDPADGGDRLGPHRQPRPLLGDRKNPYTVARASSVRAPPTRSPSPRGDRRSSGRARPAAKGQATPTTCAPSTSWVRTYALLEAKGDGALPVRFTNVTSLDAQVWPLTPRSWPGSWRTQAAIGRPADSRSARGSTWRAPTTFPARRPIQVRELIAGKGTGLFHLAPTARRSIPRTAGGERSGSPGRSPISRCTASSGRRQASSG